MTDVLPPEKQELKVTFRALVRAVGGQEACPGVARYSRHQTYSEFASIEHVEKFAPIDVIADLEAVTHGLPGHPHVTRKLCRMAGGAFVKLPPAEITAVDWHKALAALIEESRDVSMRLLAALGDAATPGIVTASEIEASKMIEETDALISVGVNLREMLKRVVAGDS
ncbi:hypothetical protein [Sphingomonas sp. SRS2]|uniref:hypothetical protein n=1 Tax=Sphingomonas sp. SRS2 TaxID=133190 RepID=UPI00061848DC|nr:hypothetical protein [Sphingomonas sp. SRS2]KKC24908.1 hypothetical protein WP12_16935 [Sphingomonas sp. SRS2]